MPHSPDPSIDLALLRAAKLYPDALMAHVVAAVTGISSNQGRHRIEVLAKAGLFELDRKTVPGHVYVSITEKGLAALAGGQARINMPLLRSVAKHNGSIAAVIIAPFSKRCSKSKLRVQLDDLASMGLISQDRRSMPGRVFVRITAAGEATLREAAQ